MSSSTFIKTINDPSKNRKCKDANVPDVNPEDLIEIINQNLTEAVFRCSFDGIILYVNDAFLRLFEVENRSEVLGMRTSAFYQDTSKPIEVNRFLMKNKSVFQGDIEFLTLSGKPFFGHLSTRSVKRGSNIYIDGVIRDRTKEVESEVAMKRQLEVQDLLLSISSDFLNADLEQIDNVIGQSLKRMGLFFGVDRMQVHDYDFKNQFCLTSYEWVKGSSRIDPRDHPKVPLRLLVEMLRMHEKGQHIFLKSVAELPDGDIKSFLIAEGIKSSLTIPMLFNNACVGFISFDSMVNNAAEYPTFLIGFLKLYANMVANISARGRNHSMLNQLIEKVTIQAKKHKDFSFITSHNIRASSANLQAISELLAEDYRGKYLTMLTSTISRLNESVTNINHILNLEHDTLLRKTKSEVVGVVRRLLSEELDNRFEAVEIAVIDELGSECYIHSLPGYLENILMQILSNSLKFGINDRSNKIEIRLWKKDDLVLLSVQDFGNGFDYNSFSSQVFKVGSRFHKNSCYGQGLGLYIVKQQMESLKGQIEIYSEVNKGTLVTLKFPIAVND